MTSRDTAEADHDHAEEMMRMMMMKQRLTSGKSQLIILVSSINHDGLEIFDFNIDYI